MKALRTTFAILCVATLGARVFDATRADAAGTTLLTRPDPAPPGALVEVIGTGFCAAPCSTVTLRIGVDVIARHVRVDVRGRFSTTFGAPFAAGSYTLRAIQTQGGTTLEGDADFTVATTDVILSGPGPTVAPNSSPRTTTPPPTSPPASSGTTVAPGPTTRPPATTRSSTSTTTRLSTSTTIATTEPSVPAATSSSTNAWPWVLVGLGVLVAAAVAAALWYRARRRRNG